MNKTIAALALVLGSVVVVVGETPAQAKLQAQLKRVFPAATSFSAKEGNLPHYKAYVPDPKTGQQAVAGYVYWTTELEPLERGYDGPIKMMVGVDTRGVLTGVLVAEHHEPYGNFSVEPPEFAAQFRGKSIRDPFKVGIDIQAISRATITITSASRAIKNSSRRIAKLYLSPESVK